MKIKDIPLDERPIERLKKVGVEHLSNEELISILIKTGTKDKSSKEVSLDLLNKIESMNNLNNVSLQELKQIKGIGDSKASIILSAVELSKRINIKDIKQITSSEHVFNLFKNKIGHKEQEEFHCIFLDNSKNIINTRLISIGTINYSVIHPREIFKEAFKASASSIICIHNHPSGNIKPSKMDIELTNNLVDISKVMGIPIIDHVIITSNNYYSFLDGELI